MALFVTAGAMSLVWAAGIAVIVLVEKVLPRGVSFGRLVGTAFILAALFLLARPDVAMGLAKGM
jgi:predicted metal-binding membrane protein